ncbi:response regulator transcription factor [Aestuariibacter halophilus]|uniref:Response regulator transcription factor n=1 Tax=Fluctibacter halophilus TaxID=226011 RepID=A0ABS8GA20_9ALTE|nr:response regulator transcription factor [Aestuariibacter halophilus]MCC2617363.1 response regulator transcription factor [Aestuariibacter halophilus]
MHAVLIIDDDNELTQLLDQYLSSQGYHITVANDGEEGLRLATSQRHFDVILLDVMMPKLDGFEVLKQLRRTHLTPVLMLTARGDDYDRILGLELGADDYLPKPFNHRELSARIKAICRRLADIPQARRQQAITVGDLAVNPARQTVTIRGEEVSMTATEYALLHLLMVNHGAVLSKEEISMQVLGRPLQAFDRSIDMHLSNVRKKLDANGSEQVIKTLRGSGYMLVDPAS